MNILTSIYGLVDPCTGEIRYIGKTNNIEMRLKNHLKDSQLTRSYKSSWIKNVYSRGFIPEIVIISLVPEETWEHAERLYIAFYKHLGHKLTNGTSGGDGAKGTVVSEYTRSLLSKAAKGKPCKEETKKKIGLANSGENAPWFGKTFSKEHLENLSKAHIGKVCSEECKVNISKSNTGFKRSEEAKIKMRQAWEKRKLKPVSEDTKLKISEGLKLIYANKRS